MAAYLSWLEQVQASPVGGSGAAHLYVFYVSWRLWEAHLYVFYVTGRLIPVIKAALEQQDTNERSQELNAVVGAGTNAKR